MFWGRKKDELEVHNQSGELDPFPHHYGILYATTSSSDLSIWNTVHYNHSTTCPISLFHWDNDVHLTVVNQLGMPGYHNLSTGAHKTFENRRTFHGLSMIVAPVIFGGTTSVDALFMFYTYHSNNILRMTYSEQPTSKNPKWSNDKVFPTEMKTKYPPSTVACLGKLFIFVNSYKETAICYSSFELPMSLNPVFETPKSIPGTSHCKSTPAAVWNGGTLYVLWKDNDDKICYTSTTDSEHWITPVQLNEITKTPLSAALWSGRIIAGYGRKENHHRHMFYGEIALSSTSTAVDA